jgi:Tol biopolymer transport system component
MMGCDSQKEPIESRWNDATEIIFGSSLESYGSIYRLNVLTGAKRRINVLGNYPVLAPNGARLAFYADDRTEAHVLGTALYTANLDGSSIKRIAHVSGPDTLLFAGLDWSSDGKQIVYSSARGEGLHQIYIFDLEKNREYELTSNGHAWDPYFSPRCDKISYVAILPQEQSGGVYVMNSDGSNQHLLTGQKLTSHPLWSADGKEIVYSKKRVPSLNLNSDIFRCDDRESNIIQMTFDGMSWAISWSPDDQKILFLSERDGSRDLYLMDKDGKNQTRITTGMNANVQAQWSPGGQMLVFGIDDQIQGGEMPLWLWQSGRSPQSLHIYATNKVSWIPNP